MAQTQEKTMPSQQEALSILQQFIADEDADLAGRGGGSFWPSNWHRITPLEGKAETLLDAATHERFCLHYLRRTHVPPTLSEAGLPGFNVSIWHGLYAPKGTPPAVLGKLNSALRAALKDPDFIKKQEELGALVVTDNRVTPDGHKKYVSDQINKLKAVIDAAGQYAD